MDPRDMKREMCRKERKKIGRTVYKKDGDEEKGEKIRTRGRREGRNHDHLTNEEISTHDRNTRIRSC